MKACPACYGQVQETVAKCPHCGAVLPPSGRPADRPAAPQAFSVHARTPATRLSRLPVLVAVAVTAAAVLLIAYWYLVLRPRHATAGGTPSKIRGMELERNGSAAFDRSFALPGDPLGMVWHDNEFLIGNRTEPWGFIRVAVGEDSDAFTAQNVPVMEPVFNQRMGFTAVTWNGNSYVAYTEGAWFRTGDKNVFTVHDPRTLQVLERHPAPELIGGLAWDGTTYWAATRRNTADSGEPAFLYKLDASFQVLERYDPPDIGCQGLAADGSFLWFADVFSRKIYRIDISEDPPSVAQTYQTPFNYLSGIAYDGANVWITEYDGKKAWRLNPRVKRMLVQGETDGLEQDYAQLEQAPDDKRTEDEIVQEMRDEPQTIRHNARALIHMGRTDLAVRVLQELLRDEREDAHDQAAAQLKEMGAPLPYDIYTNHSPSMGDEDVDVLSYSAELIGDQLVGSCELHFGEGLFAGIHLSGPGLDVQFPTFARYTLTVRGGGLRQPLENTYDASPGTNRLDTEELAQHLDPGDYTVEIFLHVQYVDSTGTNRVLNQSAPGLEVSR
jgi:hypothetical protein